MALFSVTSPAATYVKLETRSRLDGYVHTCDSTRQLSRVGVVGVNWVLRTIIVKMHQHQA